MSESLKVRAARWAQQNEGRFAPVYGGEFGLNHVPDSCVALVADAVRTALEQGYHAGLMSGRKDRR